MYVACETCFNTSIENNGLKASDMWTLKVLMTLMDVLLRRDWLARPSSLLLVRRPVTLPQTVYATPIVHWQFLSPAQNISVFK